MRTPDHYDYKIQPVDFILANDIPFCEGNVIKYVCRWKLKNGVNDLMKAKHYLQMLIDAADKDAVASFNKLTEDEGDPALWDPTSGPTT